VVLGSVAHDTSAWTEGLEIDNGTLYESTGLAGRSQLRELDPDTGRLRRASPLPDGSTARVSPGSATGSGS